MKIKTMLRFLLCFLIIGNCLCFQDSQARRVVDTQIGGNGSVSQAAGSGQSTTNVGVVSGGPSASQFFSEGRDVYNNMTSNVDSKLSTVKHIQSLIMYLGILSAVVVVLIFGIQWVTATSARRQELKAGMWPLAIGIILLVIGPKLVISIYNTFALDSATSVQHANKVAGAIIRVVQTIGYIVAIVMILWSGIQWVTATPNKRQELKSRMLNIVIGAILIAGGVTILDWIANIATNDMTAGIESPHIVAQNIEDIKL